MDEQKALPETECMKQCAKCQVCVRKMKQAIRDMEVTRKIVRQAK